MLQRWYYQVADWLTRDLAGWHYAIGISEWREGRYEQAASRWQNTVCLDPNRTDANYWYYEANKALAMKKQNSTTDLLNNSL